MNGAAEPVQVSTQDGIGVVTLARPEKRNAINAGMIARFGEIFASPPRDWRAAVIAGEGPHFSAGLDLAEHRDRTAIEVVDISQLWHRATQSILDCGIPVIASLHGAVIGAGLELAASTHIRVADASTRFSLPEGKRGIFVGGGASVRVGQLIGASRLVEMMLTAREVEAGEAMSIGLCHRVAPAGGSLAMAMAIARDVAQNAPLSNRMILCALHHIDQMPSAAGLFTESLVAALTQTSGESVARMDQFLTRKADAGG